MNTKIFIGSDHGGYRLKEKVKKYLKSIDINCVDLGNHKLDPQDDYPVFAQRVAKKVAKENGKGILLCRNGAGVCIVANKIKGIRAVQAFTPKMAQKSREDDDSNILCLGADYLNLNLAKKIIDIWLNSKASNAKRHRRRINQIKKIEKRD